MLNVELGILAKEGVKADVITGVGALFARFLPQQPLVNLVSGRTGEALLGKILFRRFPALFMVPHAFCHLFPLPLRQAHLTGQLDADALRFAVNAQQVVHNLAQLVLHTHHGWVAQLRQSLTFLPAGRAG